MILCHTRGVTELLTSRKITVDVLQAYATQKRITVGPKPTKGSIIDSIVKNWNENRNEAFSDVETFSPTQLREFSQEFASWFFTMLCSMNGFGEVHFWEDAKMRVVRIEHVPGGGTSSVITDVEGAGEIVKYYVCEMQRSGGMVRFNPFDVEGEQDGHGLTHVVAKGTVSPFIRNFAGNVAFCYFCSITFYLLCLLKGEP